ncbi:hypothetical protein FQN57_001639 [Myotisia sp. PD_48]|nr:hypothetical protein FQN57_001639 [Myotisia sp. PD_48]
MGTRGLWNLYFAGKWYRFHDVRSCIRSIREPGTVRQIRSILTSLDNLKGWEPVHFPSPLQSNLDYVYTIDVDTGTLTITHWEELDGRLQPSFRQVQLSCLDEAHTPILDSLARVTHEISEPEDEEAAAISSVTLKELEIDPGPPTALNELQFLIYLDFCFVWRPFMDDSSTWRYPSVGFNTIAIGLLRIAAWDLEVSSDTKIYYAANGKYQYKSFDLSGYFQGSILPKISHKDAARLIILSFRHVAFVEILSGFVFCTRVLPLIVDTSTLQCSPGFRLLSYVLSSYCWKPSITHREQLGVNLPAEILDLILGFCTPKAALALSQASFMFQEWYYSTIPQISLSLQSFKRSVLCCGKKRGICKNWVYCPCCYVCKHVKCVGLKSGPPADAQVVCSHCKEGKNCTKLSPGGIYGVSRRYLENECNVSVIGSHKVLRLRRGMPTHLRPEMRLFGDITHIPPRLINFTIRFNGAFTGLAYGLDDS